MKFFKLNCTGAVYPLKMILPISRGEYEIYVSWKNNHPTRANYNTLLVGGNDIEYLEMDPPINIRPDQYNLLYFSITSMKGVS